MKKKLLYFTSIVLLSVTTINAQIKVWDFGGETVVDFDSYTFENMLSPTAMNAWYSNAAGSTGVTLPAAINITPNLLRWTGGVNSDRLRVANTAITRYDESVSAGSGDYSYLTGRMYVNSGAKVDRGLHVTLTAGQEITLIARSDASPAGRLNFVKGSYSATAGLSATMTEYHFTAPTAGEYDIFDDLGKPSFYRLYLGNVVTPKTLLSTDSFQKVSQVNVYAKDNKIFLSNVKSKTAVSVYTVAGALVKTAESGEDTSIDVKAGVYVVKASSAEGTKSVKVIVQ